MVLQKRATVHMRAAPPDLFTEQRAKDEGMARAECGHREQLDYLRAELEQSIYYLMTYKGARLAYVTSDNAAPLIRAKGWDRGNWIGSLFKPARWVCISPRGTDGSFLPDYESKLPGSHGNMLRRWTLNIYADEVRAADARAA